MKIKLQPASATEMNGYNPILPPSAITQVMLIANPHNVSKQWVTNMEGEERVEAKDDLVGSG